MSKQERLSCAGFSAMRDVADDVMECDVWSCEGQPIRCLYHPVADAHRAVCLSCAEEMILLGGWIDHTNDQRIRAGGTAIGVRRTD